MKINRIQSLALLAGILSCSSALAVQQGDWLVRARVINVSPHVDSDQIKDTTGAPFSAPSGVDVDAGVSLDIDITYMYTNNIGVELLLDIASKHDIKGTGTLAGLGKVGEVTTLPPALIAQYHFAPQSDVRPYAGAGINYTMFLQEKTTSSLTNALGANSTGLKVDNTASFLVQAGVDIDIDQEWYFNLDAKYFFMNTSATISANGADAATVDFDLNPLVIGVGVGRRF